MIRETSLLCLPMGVEGLLMMPHNLVPFHVIAAGGGVRHVRDGEELVSEAKFLEVRGILEIELVVETFSAVPHEDAQR